VIVLTEAVNVLSVVLLPAASALLLEELTYGGLVRLLLAPKPGTSKGEGPGGADASLKHRRGEPNHPKGGGKCSH
jgi:hypothetical protein